MTFAERLRDLRQQAGLTQEQLADNSGLSTGAIRNYEQGIREPNWVGVFKLAEALGVSCEAFKGCIEGAAPEKPPAKGKAAGQGGKGKPAQPPPPSAEDLKQQGTAKRKPAKGKQGKEQG